MEQAHTCKRHCHAKSVARRNYIVVPNRTARLCNIGNATFRRALNIVAKGEKRITAQRNTFDSGKVGFLFFLCQRCRLFCKQCLPYALCQYVLIIIGNVNVNSIVAVRTSNLRQERRFNTFSC